MATSRAFRLLNVFTVHADPFSGNPLCVFEDGSGLSDAQMQAIARQFNLSETTFVLPASLERANAQVRIFTPTFEMPFAGHPTLGTAHVVRDLRGCGHRVRLQMKAGVVEVNAVGDSWTLRTVQEPRTRAAEASRSELAEMLGLAESSLGEPALWVDTGSEQLVVPVARPDEVRRARPDPALMTRHASSKSRDALAYVWAVGEPGEITARFFFLAHGGVVEDPATGSACANLGGWMLATGARLPLRLQVHQGDAVGRPSRLGLHVDSDRSVFVQGDVLEMGRGTIVL